MKVKTTRFGEVTVTPDRIYHFVHGLPGFPGEKGFALLTYQEGSPFAFLQSMTDSDLTFLVVDPFAFFSDYEFDIDDAVVQELCIVEDKPPCIMNIVTVPQNKEDMTVNLLAPLIVNPCNQQGLQIVLEGTNYLTRHPLFSKDTGTLRKEAE